MIKGRSKRTKQKETKPHCPNQTHVGSLCHHTTHYRFLSYTEKGLTVWYRLSLFSWIGLGWAISIFLPCKFSPKQFKFSINNYFSPIHLEEKKITTKILHFQSHVNH